MIPASAGPWLVPLGSAMASLVLFLAPWMIPVLGALWIIWTPLPLLLVYRQRGDKAGRLALGLALAGALALSLLLGGRTSGIYYLYYAAMVLVLGEAPQRRLDDAKAAGLAAAAAIAVGLVVLAPTGLIGGGEAIAGWEAAWDKELEGFVSASRQAGMEADSVLALKEALSQTGKLVTRLALGLLCAGSLLLVWANLLLARALSRKMDYQAQAAQPFNRWHAPEHLVWVVILAVGAVVALDGQAAWLGMNALLPLCVIYFFQGMAIMAYWLEKKNAPRFLRVGIYALVAVEIFLALLVALAGLFDLWFNFRRLESKPSA